MYVQAQKFYIREIHVLKPPKLSCHVCCIRSSKHVDESVGRVPACLRGPMHGCGHGAWDWLMCCWCLFEGSQPKPPRAHHCRICNRYVDTHTHTHTHTHTQLDAHLCRSQRYVVHHTAYFFWSLLWILDFHLFLCIIHMCIHTVCLNKTNARCFDHGGLRQ